MVDSTLKNSSHVAAGVFRLAIPYLFARARALDCDNCDNSIVPNRPTPRGPAKGESGGSGANAGPVALTAALEALSRRLTHDRGATYSLFYLGLSRDRLTVALGSPSETRPAWCPYAEILTQPTSRTSPARRAGAAVFDISAVASRQPSTETRLRRNIDRHNLTETRDNAGFPGRLDISAGVPIRRKISARALRTKKLAKQHETRSP